MTDQQQLIAERLRAMGALDRREQLDLDELLRSTEADLTEHLAAMDEIRNQTYRGAGGPERDDERVVAEVAGNGALLSMEISPYAMRDLDADGLANACTEALEAARSAMSEAVRERFAGIAEVDLEATPPITDAAEALRQAREMTWRA